MKNRLLSGIAVVIFGLLIALVPVRTFPACSKVIEIAVGDAVSTKCFWAGQVKIGIGVLVLCDGILLVVFRSSLTRINVNPITVLTGVLSFLVPTLPIDGRETPIMSCRVMTFPALYMLGALTIIACVANAFYLWQKNHQSRVKADG